MATNQPSRPVSGRLTKRMIKFTVQFAAVAATGYVLYTLSHLNDHSRRLDTPVAADVASAAKLAPRARSSLSPAQRAVASAGLCVGQTWPNIPPNCVVPSHSSPAEL
jgi:hypothetical protein